MIVAKSSEKLLKGLLLIKYPRFIILECLRHFCILKYGSVPSSGVKSISTK
jgi:hypothetical protein